MGVCCNSTIQNITDPEIEESNSIKRINRYNEFKIV